ncbi:MAG TPA: hypothetical protein VNF27_13805 [Candidatus Binataceae bacterium]|nr:hypothetical protein [Candidatus Binataceae bacterium]
MNESNLEGVESIRIVSAHGNLRVTRADAPPAAVVASVEPRINREGARADITLRSSAELRVPAGVALEIVDCRGNLEIEDVSAPAVLGRVGGNLRTRRTGAVVILDRIGGNAAIESSGAFECEQVGGSLAIDHASGFVRVRRIGGKLEAEATGAIDIDSVGAKAVVRGAAGSVSIRQVGGRLRLENVAGDAAIGRVGGHGAVSGVSGNLELGGVGGALELRGPFPAGKIWQAKSGGRIEAELDSDASLSIAASAGWGRIRFYGIDEGGLERTGIGRVQGSIGIERAASERTRLLLETRNADIIIARAGAHEGDYCRTGRRMPGAFDELGEILSAEFGGEIPGFVSSILGAAGRIVARGGKFSGNMMRDAGGEVSAEVAGAVEEFSRKLSEEIRRASRPGCIRTRAERREMRDSIQDAARRMRDAIREARRAARHPTSEGRPAEPDASAPAASAPRPGGTRPLDPAAYQGDIMKILQAVKSGEIEPEEADEMIAALTEAEQAGENPPRGA